MNVDNWHLIANEVQAVERDAEGLATLWLAMKSPRDIRYVAISRFHNSDDVYIERDDQIWSCNNGIEKVLLGPTGLKVHLNAIGISHLGGMDYLDVTFGPQVKASYESVKKVLQILLPLGILSIQQ